MVFFKQDVLGKMEGNELLKFKCTVNEKLPQWYAQAIREIPKDRGRGGVEKNLHTNLV